MTCCVFDAVGTLIAPRQPVAEVYWQHGQRLTSPPSRDETAERLQRAIAREFWLDPGTRRTSDARERVRWRRVVEADFG